MSSRRTTSTMISGARWTAVRWIVIAVLTVGGFWSMNPDVAYGEPISASVDASVGPRSNFPMFGSVAAEVPVATIVGSVSTRVNFELTWVMPLEQAASDAIAEYVDGLLMVPLHGGILDNVSVGVENFYAPSQGDLDDILFVVGLARWEVPVRLPLVLGLDLLWPAIIDTYDGDTAFLQAKSPLQKSLGAWSGSLTPTLIAGNSPRFTILGKASIRWQSATRSSFHVDAEAAHTWDSSEYSIPFTPSVGLALAF